MKTRRTPNYAYRNYAESMGPKLRALVESQLTDDLRYYGIRGKQLKFDWSDSCIEGRHAELLDGSLDRFSGIAVFDYQDELLAEGWMDFVHHGDYFIAYWQFIDIWEGEKQVGEKTEPGMPGWICDNLPGDIQSDYKLERQ